MTLSPSRLLASGHRLYYLRDYAATDAFFTSSPPFLPGAVIGFDIEHPPCFVKGQPPNKIALVQLASDSSVFLIQVSAMPFFPSSVKAVLENPQITKVGVGIQSDAAKLRVDFGVNLASWLELGRLARAVDPSWMTTQPAGLISLARLVAKYNNRAMNKPKRIQLSNWASCPLSEAQEDYAADDALSALAVYHALSAMRAPAYAF